MHVVDEVKNIAIRKAYCLGCGEHIPFPNFKRFDEVYCRDCTRSSASLAYSSAASENYYTVQKDYDGWDR